mgnify:CR=1 FL=1
MKKIAIVTDSNAGISPQMAKELGVFVIPQPFMIEGKTYFENIDLTYEEFYKTLENEVDVRTSQPVPTDMMEVWDEVLKEPLAINRMQKETLDSMWKAINDSKEHLVKFLQRKAELLGIEKLSWYDVDAPLVNAPQQKLSYNEGAEFDDDAVESRRGFGRFSMRRESQETYIPENDITIIKITPNTKP